MYKCTGVCLGLSAAAGDAQVSRRPLGGYLSHRVLRSLPHRLASHWPGDHMAAGKINCIDFFTFYRQ